MLKVNINKVSINKNGGNEALLKNIEFELPEGSVYTILGQNGTGKSTLIKSLTKLLNKQIYCVDGNVRFKNTELFNCNKEDLLSIRLNNIRYVFQDAINSFDPLKTFEYYFNNSNSELNRIDELLEYYLLPDFVKLSSLYPYEVSGGMAQRISIVLAFLANPDLIILDEPTSGIDYAISNLLLHKLNSFKRKKGSVLIVTHDITFAKKASDQLSVLSGGTLKPFKFNTDFFSQPDIEMLNPAEFSKDKL